MKNSALDDLDESTRREVERQMAEIRRGVVQIVGEEDLERRIGQSVIGGRPLRVKLGVDPTAHELHLGFTVPLTKLRVFSDLGHRPVLIIGDATAMVGDPAGRNKARPQLDRETVDAFASSYLDQAARVLDIDKVEVRRNSEWLHELGFEGLVRLAAKSTVARMLERDDFKKRFAEGTPIFIHEFIYPLMQGWDSVVVEADVELGGQDQLFNLLVGRDLQVDAGLPPQVCIMGPLLVGLDGARKMSKSFGNYIGLADDPIQMFGKIMSLPDEVMRTWFELVTRLPLVEVDAILDPSAHPRGQKARLAEEVVRRFHGPDAAAHAASEFDRVFSRHELPSEIPEVDVSLTDPAGGALTAARLLVATALAVSNNEARRLIAQGGVSINGVTIDDPNAVLSLDGGEVLRVGKKRFVRLRVC